MDLNIYERQCQIHGHRIYAIQQDLLDPKANKAVTITKLLCSSCGGEDAELQEAPKGFKKKTRQEKPVETGA